MYDIKLLGTDDGQNHGTRNDLAYDTAGMVQTISLASKLKQDMTKIMISEVGDNKFFTNYGTNLQSLLHKNMGQADVRKEILASVMYAIYYLNGVVNENGADAELIKSITSVDIRWDKTDPRIVYVRVEVLNKLDETIILTVGS